MNANYDGVSICEANVVTLCQSGSENARLERRLLSELSVGSEVGDFAISGAPFDNLLLQSSDTT